jgi:choline dehydrogenase-like flavoprotein
MNGHDYIIVGAGASGCALAYRLTADASIRVLLIEAGGRGDHPFVHMPKGIAKAMTNANLIWQYMTEPEAASNGVAESWARGRTLGGSSSVNGMVYVRGQDADYNALAALSSEDWSWQHMGAAFKALESHELGAAATRGGSGPLHISLPRERTELLEAAIRAGEAQGLRRQEDVNDPEDHERIGYCPRTIFKGRRQSAAVAFLEPVAGRKNLTVVTGVVVDRLLWEGRRAVGVEGTQAGKAVIYRADQEVILAAGTLSTPAILQRSGVGSAEKLHALSIPVIHDSAEVGENVREHRGLVMQWRIQDKYSNNREFQGARLVRNTARYYLKHDGPMADGAYEVGGWFKSQPHLSRPDGQILVAPFTVDYASPTFRVEPFGGMNICVYMLRPDSLGSVAVRSRNPLDLPKIRAGYTSAEIDRRAAIDIVRYVRNLVAQPVLQKLLIEETRPGPQFASDAEILEAHKKFGYGSYHASGSCRMGKDEASVVDPRLRVRGVDAVRVIDTSVFPFMLAGNTNAAATAVGWRAADLMLADAKQGKRANAA